MKKLLLLTLPLAAAANLATANYPAARMESGTETRFGTTYHDPYRWMDNLSDPKLGEFIRAQNTYVADHLRNTEYETLREEFREIFSPATPERDQLDNLEDIIHQQNYLKRFAPEDHLNPTPITNQPISPSKRYAIQLHADSGSDFKILTINDLENNTVLGDVLKVKFADTLWDEDEDSFIYVSDRDDRVGDVYPVIRRHRLGTKQNQDQILVESAKPGNWLQLLKITDDYLLIEGDGKTATWSAMDPATGELTTLRFGVPDRTDIIATWQDQLLCKDFEDSDRGAVTLIDPKSNSRRILVAPKLATLAGMFLHGDDLIITYINNRASHDLIHVNLATGKEAVVASPRDASFAPYAREGEIEIMVNSYTQKTSRWQFDAAESKLVAMEPAPATEVELTSNVIFYSGPNGISTPIHVIHRRDLEVTSHTPVYLYGYGGFRISLVPYYSKYYMPWIKRGGIVAIATLPGGHEFGEAWYRAGSGLNKHQVFDAFAAAARTLHDHGVSSPRKTVIGGASNGGLLAAATAGRNPDLFQGAIPEVGVLDLTSFELFTAGKWWVNDYGTRFAGMDFHQQLALSPYHRLKPGRYPHTLVIASDLDDRVVPSHSYKYAAQLQRLQDPDRRAWLYTQRGASHSYRSGSLASQIDYQATKWAFALLVTEND